MEFAESCIVLIVHNLKTIDFRVNYGKDGSKFIIKTSSSVLNSASGILYIHLRKSRARRSALIAVAKFQPNYHFGQPPGDSEFPSADADAQQKTGMTSECGPAFKENFDRRHSRI